MRTMSARRGRLGYAVACSEITARILIGRGLPLPAVVGERLVGLRHLLEVVLALDRCADAVAGIEQLAREPLRHGLLTTLTAVADEPANGERGGPAGTHLDRH